MSDPVREPTTAELLRQALQDLQLSQIELELQSDELAAAQHRIDESRAALDASEQRYRELFESAPVGRVHLDASGAVLELNRATLELVAGQRSETLGRKLSEFVAVRSQDALYTHCRAAARGTNPAPARVQVRALDGRSRDVELVARPIAGGQLSVALLDVTARERAFAEREEGERQRRLLSDVVPIAVCYVDADGRCEFCNGAFEKLCGLPAARIEGHPIFEVLDPESYAALREHMRAALEGEIARFEGRLYFASVGQRFFSVLLAPDRTRDGQVRGFCALIDDRSELEEARRAVRDGAAQASLAEERERRALASDLHDDVGQLVSLLAIKLRELRAQVGGSGSRGRLGELEDLTRQIRKRISSLSFELSPPLLYDVGFAAAAEWLAESLQGRYGLRTSIERQGNVPPLDEATSVTLFRALRELLINVARHAGTNRARVVLAGGVGEVSLTVRDEGCGFEFDATTGGFGLRSLRERIELLGGRTSVESSPRSGTTVSIHVPAPALPKAPG